MDNKKIWFKRKLYGWGWTPSTWEGWVVLFVLLVLFVFIVSKIDHEDIKNIWVAFLFTGILVFICYKKGEKPKWQWGKRIEDENK